MANKKNPFAGKVKQGNKKKPSGKRIGKSKPDKANNQLNRRVKQAFIYDVEERFRFLWGCVKTWIMLSFSS